LKILFSSIDNRLLGTHTWTHGFKPLVYSHQIRSEDDALARALWLENHLSSEDGLEYLENWLGDFVHTKH